MRIPGVKKTLFILSLAVLLQPAALIQAQESAELDAEQLRRVTLATSDPEYPVTPGDVYRLRFMPGNQTTSLDIVIQNDFSVELGVIGGFNARGLNYSDFRTEVRTRVNRAYPGSQPVVQIRQTGLFTVSVDGEVDSSYRRESWGLTRLSTVIAGRTTSIASLRDVEVQDASGNSKRYDLFRARRFGEQAENPLIRPGDRVIVHRLERELQVSGQVNRPGTYQLLPDDDVETVLELYAGGLAPGANPRDMQLTRRSQNNSEKGDQLYFSYLDNELPELSHRDHIFVDSLERLRPFIFIEGAIGVSDAEGTRSVRPDAMNRISRQIRPGTRLHTIVQQIRPQFSDISDLPNAYVQRGNEQIPVNIQNLLYSENHEDNIPLQANDRIVIPFQQMFVTIGGAVHSPGRYPYIQDRDWRYYAMLAGGVDREKNAWDAVEIFDQYGEPKDKSDPIGPEDSIYVRTNSPVHKITRVAQIIGPVATTIVVIFNIINMF